MRENSRWQYGGKVSPEKKVGSGQHFLPEADSYQNPEKGVSYYRKTAMGIVEFSLTNITSGIIWLINIIKMSISKKLSNNWLSHFLACLGNVDFCF